MPSDPPISPGNHAGTPAAKSSDPVDPKSAQEKMQVKEANRQAKIQKINDAVIRIAGNSQDGIQAVGAIMARLAGRSEQDVMTYMTIPSTISGGPSIFQVRIGSGEIVSSGDQADFLVAFYQHSYNDHIGSLKKGGIVLFDSDHVKPDTENKSFNYVGVPMTGLTVEAIGGTARDKGKNMFLLGLLIKIFDLDVAKVEKLLGERFGTKDASILNNALAAFHAGYSFPVGNVMDIYQFDNMVGASGLPRVTMNGNEAIAIGAIAAGVRFGSGYPITPWSDIMEYLRRELPKYGGLFIQAEDEIAAVSMAIGASYAGHLALTGSSGPGISLKTEAIGYAVMAEIPLIIIDVQRGGPSTGLPTNVEQSDLYIACFGGHGDSPRVVIAPNSVEDCFYTVIEAVNIARKFSVPVIVLTDQALATRIEAFDEPDLAKYVQNIMPDFKPKPAGWTPYPVESVTHHAPPGTYMSDGKYPLVTGLEHDEYGHPTGKPALHKAMTAKRRNKLRKIAEEYAAPKVYGPGEGNILLVGWGSTWGPIREAVDKARAAGDSVSGLNIRHINPLPNGLEEIFDGFNHIYVAELNDEGVYGYGQLATILRARYCDPKITSISKSDGLNFKVADILNSAKETLSREISRL
ncbi:MAG: 2-oxoacid:acceptor oxidoreductase subunit alpha [Verrucomicrobiae bacterium]|nr:2-oxoacid:acceptor oxidoreductase subunit alpha [Verrucomicrobiae bacterium]